LKKLTESEIETLNIIANANVADFVNVDRRNVITLKEFPEFMRVAIDKLEFNSDGTVKLLTLKNKETAIEQLLENQQPQLYP
jgi:hypothetical protein